MWETAVFEWSQPRSQKPDTRHQTLQTPDARRKTQDADARSKPSQSNGKEEGLTRQNWREKVHVPKYPRVRRIVGGTGGTWRGLGGDLEGTDEGLAAVGCGLGRYFPVRTYVHTCKRTYVYLQRIYTYLHVSAVLFHVPRTICALCTSNPPPYM